MGLLLLYNTGQVLILNRDIVAGMDAAEMQESFEGQCEDDYHPFKNGAVSLE